ncbi:HNH endonuclease [Actinomadura sp. DC4]|uniref:HNH endonuclease n=1 Tax=Actinomadura sp. DC4 TaxID=3055069 RepID=UPI0025AF7060|nr:HNH endonuclease [Actinomadura sp. DC4]MDN3351347.1 HNH endonuclease [Actinomadura sp. DC4]
MKAYVGVTDGSWYRFLAARPKLGEVNFWRPSSKQAFRSLGSGEPFFFKTKAPQNRIVGGGFFSDFVRLPLSEAWDRFGEANGAASLSDLRHRINTNRAEPITVGDDPVIGCILVRDVRFFVSGEEAEPPHDFASNLVQGKRYDLATHVEAGYLERLVTRLLGRDAELDDSQPWRRPGAVFGDPRLSRRRLGQSSFKTAVLAAYEERCAVTGSRLRPTLQAAHIRPVSEDGEHRLDNGLLLRADLHALFDAGYLGVDLDYRFKVSARLRADFEDGEEFYARVGQPIALPERAADRPNRAFLEWHEARVFKAS